MKKEYNCPKLLPNHCKSSPEFKFIKASRLNNEQIVIIIIAKFCRKNFRTEDLLCWSTYFPLEHLFLRSMLRYFCWNCAVQYCLYWTHFILLSKSNLVWGGCNVLYLAGKFSLFKNVSLGKINWPTKNTSILHFEQTTNLFLHL